LETERANLLAALHAAAQADLPHHTLAIASNSMRFLFTAGSWEDFLDVVSRAADVARMCGDSSAESYFLARRGEANIEMQRMEAAARDFDTALELACKVGDRLRHAWALNGRAFLSLHTGRYHDAAQDLQEALLLSRGDTGRLKAVLEGNLCGANIGMGNFHTALEHGERSLELRRRLGDLRGEPYTLHLLARAWGGLGEHERAIELCRRAIELGRAAGDFVDAIAEPLDTLGIALLHTGNTEAAVACWREALMLFEESGRPHQAHEARDRIRMALVRHVDP
jgi:tetratricopeptide (TPR) repeat protein